MINATRAAETRRLAARAVFLGFVLAASLFCGRSLAALNAIVINDPAPDGNGQFQIIRAPALNDEGVLAFQATLTDTAGGNRSDDRFGIFQRDAAGTITQIARGLESAPGGGTFTSSYGEAPLLNNAGEVAFATQGSSGGIYRGAPLVKIARNNQAAPGSGVFTVLRLGGMNDVGQISFFGAMTGTTPSTANLGVFRSDGETVAEIARSGGAAPGGGAFASLNSYTKINESGQVAFFATTNDPASPAGVFRGDGAQTTAIARQGQPAPAMGGGTNGIYSGFGVTNVPPTAINDVGQLAFTAQTSATSSGYTAGLFRGNGVETSMILHTGLPAPNATSGTTGSFSAWDRPVINNSGQVIVWAQLQGTPGGTADDAGIFVGDGTTLRQIAREGDLAPDGNGRFQFFSRNTIINDAGQTAFYASHTAAAVGTSGGIYFHDPEDGLTTIARVGQPLLGSTITNLTLAGNNLDIPINDMETSGLNELGQVAFQFRLASGVDGVAIWSALKADFNDDGDVDGDDLAIWGSHYGEGSATQPIGDASGDEVVDGTDFLMWQREVTSAPTLGGTPVPEPTAWTLAGIVACVVSRRRRWQEP